MKTLKMIAVVLFWMAVVGVAGAEVPVIKVLRTNGMVQVAIPKSLARHTSLNMFDLNGNPVKLIVGTPLIPVIVGVNKSGDAITVVRDNFSTDPNIQYIIFGMEENFASGQICFQQKSSIVCLDDNPNNSDYIVNYGFGLKSNFPAHGFKIDSSNVFTVWIDRINNKVVLEYPFVIEFPVSFQKNGFINTIETNQIVGIMLRIETKNGFNGFLYSPGVIDMGSWGEVHKVRFPIPDKNTHWVIKIYPKNKSPIVLEISNDWVTGIGVNKVDTNTGLAFVEAPS